MQKETIQISFSGGRTSAYMTYKMLTELSDDFNFIVTFANTGREHPKTLEFVNNCDKYLGFNTVWLEAVVYPNDRKSNGHKIVSYETANRDGSIFEETIQKYGIPNLSFPNCTRELKLNPMKSYLKSLGIKEVDIRTAIGIRNDETRRVNENTASRLNLIYPLVDWFPTDKQMVLDWWGEQEFDLGIEEFEGNCLACFKKSLKKQCMQIAKDPSVFEWTREMEEKYRTHKIKDGLRVFFRSNLDTDGLFKFYEETKEALIPLDHLPDANGGCSESCELYDMS